MKVLIFKESIAKRELIYRKVSQKLKALAVNPFFTSLYKNLV
tara:strand:- start:1812 stop:1937 length:126 start_codon:yes stop_codon:yes gene_type:complete